MTTKLSRRNMLALLGGAGLAGGAGLLSSCGGGGGVAGTPASVQTQNSCTLINTATAVVPGTNETTAADLLQTTPVNQAATYRNVDKLYPTRVIGKGAAPSVLAQHSRSLCSLQYNYGRSTYTLSDYFTRNRTAGLLILKNSAIALEQYAMGNSASTRWTSFSVAKSVTSTLVGAALNEGRIASLDDTVPKYLPTFATSDYAQNTLRDLLTMTSGIAWDDTGIATGAGTLSALFAAAKTGVPNAVLNVMRNCKRSVPAGTEFNYSTGETYLLGAIVAAATGRKLSNYFSEKIATPMGMETDGYWILDSANGLEMGGNNFSATLRDYARFGQFFLRDGSAGYPRVLPVGWRDLASQPSNAATAHGKLYLNYPLGYGYQWWSFPTGTSAIAQGLAVHDGAFTAQGIYGQYLYINPKENAVVVVWSARPTALDDAYETETYSLIAAALAALR
jgi:CubicO group peptidase (beta-lactamase class C family)